MKTSTFLTLNPCDFLRGLSLAVIAAVLTVIQNSLAAGSIDFDWKNIAQVAGSAAVSYLIKNYFSGTKSAATITQNS